MRHVIRTNAKSLRAAGAAALALVAAIALPGCGKQQKTSDASSYLIVESFVAAKGVDPEKDLGTLDSDVSTEGAVYADLGRARFQLGLKDPGTPADPAQPTMANFITVYRYHVKYIRSDGKNVQGVDVPWEFDGGTSVTVGIGSGFLASITLVRVQAKLDSPLRALVNLGGSVAITTTAEVTFYGKDQAGHDVSAKAYITVNFADFADPS